MFEYQFLITVLHALGFTIFPESNFQGNVHYVTASKESLQVLIAKGSRKIVPQTTLTTIVAGKKLREHDAYNFKATISSMIELLTYHVHVPNPQDGLQYNQSRIEFMLANTDFIDYGSRFDLVVTGDFVYTLHLLDNLASVEMAGYGVKTLESYNEVFRYVQAAQSVREAIYQTYRVGR